MVLLPGLFNTGRESVRKPKIAVGGKEAGTGTSISLDIIGVFTVELMLIFSLNNCGVVVCRNGYNRVIYNRFSGRPFRSDDARSSFDRNYCRECPSRF